MSKIHKGAGLLIMSLGVSGPSNYKIYSAVPACPEAWEAPEITTYPEDPLNILCLPTGP